MVRPDARISRVGNSWRVRVFGYQPMFFSDRKYGSTSKALTAARKWRDARWSGKNAGEKLTPAQRRYIGRSTSSYKDVAAAYGISPNYVHQLRSQYERGV